MNEELRVRLLYAEQELEPLITDNICLAQTRETIGKITDVPSCLTRLYQQYQALPPFYRLAAAINSNSPTLHLSDAQVRSHARRWALMSLSALKQED